HQRQHAAPGRPAPVPDDEPPRRRVLPLVLAALAVLALLAAGLVLALGGDDGGDRVTIPADIVGQTQEQATTRLEALGLSVRIEPRESDEEQQGRVLETQPAAGQEVDAGGEVVLVVGQGPAAVAVPDVVGRTREDAEVALTQAGFRVRVTQAFDDEVEQGRVISQTPAGGQQAAAESQVTIQVSRGAEPVQVPNLVGDSLSTARAELEAAGLEVGDLSDRSSERPEGTVLEQDPRPGQRVERGSRVNLVVAAGPELVSVPNVIGSSLDKAQSSLEGAGFDVTTVSAPSNSPAGTVVDQSPPAGAQVEAGATITLTVSDGPAEEPEPDAGTTPPAATAPAQPPPPAQTTGAAGGPPGLRGNPGNGRGNGRGNGNGGEDRRAAERR
ncbi:MAG TPA: PASTA domain-containing protein, partial [Miltoncostaeaceae bacterium]|nr:PASTA domain-containing protein [Miltoncostaeaceae bacterium]